MINNYGFANLKKYNSMFSVIIPSFNRAVLLKKSIESVLSQSMSCGEIVIIDDGSTDETSSVIKKLQSKNQIPIRYFFQNNMGAAAARNKGVVESQYDYICFLDSDDCFVPEKIQMQYQAMVNHPNYLISHTREIWYRRGVLINQKKKHQPPHGDIFKRCLPMCVVGFSTVMVRREIFDKFGFFDETMICCEDYDYWLKVSTVENFLLVAQPLTVKNGGREDQLSVVHRMGMDKYRIRSILNLLDNSNLTAQQAFLAVEELKKKAKIYGNGCIKHGREEEGRRYLDLLMKYQR